MGAAPLILGIGSLLLGGASFVQQTQAANKAEKAGEKQAAAIGVESEEKKRKLAEEAAYRKSLAKARAGASGVQLEGSVAQYLEGMDDATAKDLAWMDKAASYGSAAAVEAGDLASLNAMSGAWGSLANTFSTGASLWNKK